MPTSTPPPRATRRAVLAGGTAVLAGWLTGCRTTLTPTPTPSPGTSTAATPPIDRASLAADLLASAALFGVAAAPKLRDSSDSLRKWAAAAQAMAQRQAEVLSAEDPLAAGTSSGTPTPASVAPTSTASGTGSTAKAVLAAIAQHQRALEGRLVQACLASTDGDQALLYGSLAVTSRVTQAVGPVVGRTSVSPAAGPIATAVEARGVLLTRVQALIQGLQRGLGVLSSGDALRTSGLARLVQVQALRDQLQQTLDNAGATPAPVALDYAMPGPLTTRSQISTTWGLLERGVLDAWLLVTGAAQGTERVEAQNQALGQVAQVSARGVGLTWWPGWV